MFEKLDDIAEELRGLTDPEAIRELSDKEAQDHFNNATRYAAAIFHFPTDDKSVQDGRERRAAEILNAANTFAHTYHQIKGHRLDGATEPPEQYSLELRPPGLRRPPELSDDEMLSLVHYACETYPHIFR